MTLGSLSEMAVLGVSDACLFDEACRQCSLFQFEYGASWERPNLLAIWEAQVRFTPSFLWGVLNVGDGVVWRFFQRCSSMQ